MVGLEGLVRLFRMVCRQQVNVQIIDLKVKFFIFFVPRGGIGCVIDPNSDYLARLVHHIYKFWRDLGNLHVTSASLLILRSQHFMGQVQRLLDPESMKINSIDLCEVVLIENLELSEYFVIKTLNHGKLSQVILSNQFVKLSGSFLESVAWANLRISWDFQFYEH